MDSFFVDYNPQRRKELEDFFRTMRPSNATSMLHIIDLYTNVFCFKVIEEWIAPEDEITTPSQSEPSTEPSNVRYVIVIVCYIMS